MRGFYKGGAAHGRAGLPASACTFVSSGNEINRDLNIKNINPRLPNLLRWLRSVKPDVVALAGT